MSVVFEQPPCRITNVIESGIAGRRPDLKTVKERDVVAALGKLRDLLQGDVGVAAQVLKALVGDVVLETRQAEDKAKPQMVARFTINAVPALAVLERNKAKEICPRIRRRRSP